MTPNSLADAVEAILDAIVAAVESRTANGSSLEEVQSVVRGDRARPMPKLPTIWVVPEPASNEASGIGRGLSEDWVMPVRIAALVSGDDPDVAGRLAVRLAANARAAALADRSLGLPYATTKSRGFDARRRGDPRNRTLHWADATIVVRFRVLEEP